MCVSDLPIRAMAGLQLGLYFATGAQKRSVAFALREWEKSALVSVRKPIKRAAEDHSCTVAWLSDLLVFC